MAVRVKASDIEAGAKLQNATALRMAPGRRTRGDEPAQGHTTQYGAGSGKERAATDLGMLCVPVHVYPPRIQRDHTATSGVQQSGQGSRRSRVRVQSACERS